MDEQNEETTVIACSLTDKELAARLEELTQALFAKAEHVVELEDGYAFRSSGSAEQAKQLTRCAGRTSVLPILPLRSSFRSLRRTDHAQPPWYGRKAFTRFMINDTRRMNGAPGTAY